MASWMCPVSRNGRHKAAGQSLVSSDCYGAVRSQNSKTGIAPLEPLAELQKCPALCRISKLSSHGYARSGEGISAIPMVAMALKW